MSFPSKSSCRPLQTHKLPERRSKRPLRLERMSPNCAPASLSVSRSLSFSLGLGLAIRFLSSWVCSLCQALAHELGYEVRACYNHRIIRVRAQKSCLIVAHTWVVVGVLSLGMREAKGLTGTNNPVSACHAAAFCQRTRGSVDRGLFGVPGLQQGSTA